MLKIYSCIVTDHDLHLVAVAAVICAMASFAAVSVLHHVLRSQRLMRRVWLGVAAVATGFGIWATHFIAMLAFRSSLPITYDVELTLLSLAAAIGLTGVGLALGVTRRVKFGRWIGGAVVGGGIATMHYIGMAAVEVAGWLVWDPSYVAASIALAAVIGGLALPIGLRGNTLRWKVLGALVLTVAICSLHFTAMSAVAMVPDPEIAASAAMLPVGWLAFGVTHVSVVIIALALAGVVIDRRGRLAAMETTRMRELADAAIEGLIVHGREGMVTANRSFLALARIDGEAAGLQLDSFFPGICVEELEESAHKPLEATLRATDGETIPVELIQREIVYAGRRRHVLSVRDIRERKQAEEDIQFLAHHDPLTKLPNRTSFNKRLEAEFAAHHGTDRCFAVMFLDLDRFKQINDLFGHPTGDAVLQFVADKVGGVLEPHQMLARLGGDEFAVIVPGLACRADAAHPAEAILRAVGEEPRGLPAGVTLGTSVGIAVFPADATDRATLLSHADAALYEAKSEGRGVYRMFEASMGTHLRNRLELQHDLRHAIARNEMSLVYQPQAELQSGEVFGFEALVRWKHPTRGMVSPRVFIPIAEDCGAIVPIGEWVLRTACAEAARWKRPLAVAINVSAVQLHTGNLPELVAQVLEETGLDPARLELEITETSLIKDIGRAIDALSKLKALGVQIAMDDFGTGYSSLSNLRAFPFDRIKIDQSFVRSVDTSADAAAIVHAIVGLARGLKLPVVAEGVETVEELGFLRSSACNAMQGYYLGRPSPIDAFEHYTGRAAVDAAEADVPSERRVA